MKFTCKCGTTTIDFKHMTEKDFPNGFTDVCCRMREAADIRSATVVPGPKTTIEKWIIQSGLQARNLELFWVPAFNAYQNYQEWLKSQQIKEPCLSVTAFGRDMNRLCKKRRKSSGQYYLLQKEL